VRRYVAGYALLLLLLVISGCRTPVKQKDRLPVDSFTLEFSAGVPAEARPRATYAAVRTFARWREVFHRPSKPVTVEVCSFLLYDSAPVRGLYYRSRNLIQVTLGWAHHLPGLFHEICHANSPYDPDHRDWPWGKWDQYAALHNAELEHELGRADP